MIYFKRYVGGSFIVSYLFVCLCSEMILWFLRCLRAVSFIASSMLAIFVTEKHSGNMIDDFNFFSYAESLAKQLVAIGHSDERQRFFTAFGLEDLVSFTDRLSSLEGFVMIAVDGYESDSDDNRADALDETRHYGIIICRNTVDGDPSSVEDAFSQCNILCRQVRNRMFVDLRQVIDRSTQINGIGPLGDGFYGCLLSFTLSSTEGFLVDDDYWASDDETVISGEDNEAVENEQANSEGVEE